LLGAVWWRLTYWFKSRVKRRLIRLYAGSRRGVTFKAPAGVGLTSRAPDGESEDGAVGADFLRRLDFATGADLAATKVRFVERKIAPLKLAISNDGGERLNLLLPQLESKNLSAECSAAFNLARRLAESGLRVRVVIVDAPGPNQSELRESISSADGLED